MIRLIVGLGNPGKEHENTRHNAGFMVIDAFLRRLRIKRRREEHLSHIFRTKLGGREILLAKPMTYMNNSGLAVLNILEEEGIEPSEMLVVYDDIDLPLGALRLRERGSSGGHRGMESVIKHIKTSDFPRLRVGIGRPSKKEDVVKWVLSPFTEEEMPALRDVLERSTLCLERVIMMGVREAMNLCNSARRAG